MNSDIRIATSFYSNLKRRRLQQDLGADGVLALLDLWLFAAQHYPDGDITKLSPEEIALAANYSHNPENLLTGLVKAGFIDEKLKPDGSVSRTLHHWEIHNAWAANANRRSEAARELASKRWDKKLHSPHRDARNANGNAARNANGNAARNANGNAPLPSPNPSPSPSPSSRIEEPWEDITKEDIEKAKELFKVKE